MNAQPRPNPDPMPPVGVTDSKPSDDPFASLTVDQIRERNLAMVAFLEKLLAEEGDPEADEAALRDWEHFRATEGL